MISKEKIDDYISYLCYILYYKKLNIKITKKIISNKSYTYKGFIKNHFYLMPKNIALMFKKSLEHQNQT